MILDEDNSTEGLYEKYMAFNQLMLEKNSALELASILVIQGLTFYKTVMSEEDYQRIVQTIYDKRDSVTTFN